MFPLVGRYKGFKTVNPRSAPGETTKTPLVLAVILDGVMYRRVSADPANRHLQYKFTISMSSQRGAIKQEPQFSVLV